MAVVLGAMGSLAPKLFKLLHSEYELQKNVRKKLKFVYDELESSRAALEKVAAVPWDQLDKQVKVWACQVRDASYDMEDVLDTFLLRVEDVEPANRSRLKRAVKKMGGLFGKFKARRDIAGAIYDIEKQLQVVADRRARYKIDDIVANPSPATTVDPRLSAFYTKASQLVGIVEPRDKLIEMLSIREVDGSSNEMKIISIVGFGGLGKTTLAKSVYDKVTHHFDCGAFVPVGRNPSPCKVLRDVLIDLTDDANERKNSNGPDKISSIIATRYTGADLMSLDERQLINKVHRFLEGKRYFIVIDDIWDITTWDVLKIAFVDSNSRSRIITTTRKSKVGEEIGQVYGMKKVPESQSRQLLYARTFGMEEKWPDNDELAVISQKILRRCDGVPLAIITIGSLLAGKQIEEWSNVYDSVGFGHGTQVSNMKKILSFSYYDLPCHLRTCILYLSVFPEDYFVQRDMLRWMWIAEGIVQTHEGKQPFEVADSYILELINRGMILPVMTFGFLSGCRVHDMVLHMIRDLSREANFLVVRDSNQGSQENKVRRLAMHNARPTALKDVCIPQLRSFNAISCSTDSILPVSGFQFLRVLTIENFRPLDGYLDTEHLQKLLHLRFLGLQYTPVRDLSRDLGNLKFLQSLFLTGTGIEELPASLGQLTKLMCLIADGKTRLPDWIGKLTSLVELRGLQIHSAADHNKCFVKELGKLTDLRVLQISMTLQDEGLVREFLQALSNLQKLEAVDFRASKCVACWDGMMDLSFEICCNNLRLLNLSQLKFSRLPNWINPQALPSLCILNLKLSALHQKDMEILGMFKKLCSLLLYPCDFWSKIRISGGRRFQNLRDFRVIGLSQLDFVQGAMPRLEAISLIICVQAIKDNGGLSLHIGLGNISTLQAFTAYIDCSYCLPWEVEEVEADLRHTVSVHPNRPTLQLTRVHDDKMLTSSDSVMERQIKRAQRLWSQIGYLKTVHDAMSEEVVEMGDIKTDLNPSDAKNKVQEFHQQFSATVQLVQHKLHPAQHGTPRCDIDLNRVLDDIKAREQALEVLTLEYPRLAAMLDELRYLFSVEGAMPMPHVLNLDIRVFDIKVNRMGLDFGLLGKISSLRGIKAHVMCHLCFPTEVEEVESELRNAINIHHPKNPPSIEIRRYGEDNMVNADSDSPMLLRRQILMRSGLIDGVNNQLRLHNKLHIKVYEILEQKSNVTLSDAAKHKKQRFCEHYMAIKGRVEHKLLWVDENTANRDLKRVTEEIEDIEWALQVLTTEYPRLAAMVEELKTALGLEAEDEDEVTDEKEALIRNLCFPDRKEEDELTEEVVPAASVSEINGEEPITSSNQ